MKKEITITFEWNDLENNNDIDFSLYHEQLEEEAMARINQMMREGYTSGELNAYGEEDCIEFTGYWSVSWKTL